MGDQLIRHPPLAAPAQDGVSALELAALNSNEEILHLLIPAGALRTEAHVVAALRACAGLGLHESFITLLAMAPPPATPRPMAEFLEAAISGAKRVEASRQRVRNRGSQRDLTQGAKDSTRPARESISRLAPAADEDGAATAGAAGAVTAPSPFAGIAAACIRYGADPNAVLASTGMCAVLSAADTGAPGLLQALLDADGTDGSVVDAEVCARGQSAPQSMPFREKCGF